MKSTSLPARELFLMNNLSNEYEILSRQGRKTCLQILKLFLEGLRPFGEEIGMNVLQIIEIIIVLKKEIVSKRDIIGDMDMSYGERIINKGDILEAISRSINSREFKESVNDGDIKLNREEKQRERGKLGYDLSMGREERMRTYAKGIGEVEAAGSGFTRNKYPLEFQIDLLDYIKEQRDEYKSRRSFHAHIRAAFGVYNNTVMNWMKRERELRDRWEHTQNALQFSSDLDLHSNIYRDAMFVQPDYKLRCINYAKIRGNQLAALKFKVHIGTVAHWRKSQTQLLVDNRNNLLTQPSRGIKIENIVNDTNNPTTTTQEVKEERDKCKEEPTIREYSENMNMNIDDNKLGRSLKTEKKWAIVILRRYFSSISLTNKEIGKVMEMSIKTVNKYWNKYRISGSPEPPKHGKTPRPWEFKRVGEISREINEYLERENKNRKMPLANDILSHLYKQGYGKVTRNQLTKEYLPGLGYSFRKVTPIYTSRLSPSAQRNKEIYLREIINNRESVYPKREIFVDESFIRDIHCRRDCWVRDVQNMNMNIKNPHAGSISMVAAMWRGGWVGVDYDNIVDQLRETPKIHRSGSILYFGDENAKNAGEYGDYHESFNKKMFTEYIERQIFPHIINSPSVLIMDRVGYHTHKSINSTEQEWKGASREELCGHLLERGVEVPLSPRMPISTLRRMAQKCEGDGDSSLLQWMCGNEGHSVLYLPQYHPEFNPIEMAWSFIKRRISSSPMLDISDVANYQLPHAFQQLTGDRAQRLCDHAFRMVTWSIHNPQSTMPPTTRGLRGGGGDGNTHNSLLTHRVAKHKILWDGYTD